MNNKLKNEQAKAKIIAAYAKADGSTIEAARLLAVHKTTLLRAVRALGLSQLIAERWPRVARAAYAAVSG